MPGMMSPEISLPGDRPTAGLVADVVGVAAGDVDAGVRGQRQRVPSFFSRTCDSATACLAIARCAALPTWSRFIRRGERMLEEPELELGPQDAPDGVVDACLLTRPALTSASSRSSNCSAENGSMNMSVPALTPTRTL